MEKKGDSKGYDDESDSKGMKDYSDDMADSKGGDEYYDDGKDTIQLDVPQVDVTEIIIEPSGKCPIGDPLELKITYNLDRDVVAGYWEVKVGLFILFLQLGNIILLSKQFLVDSASSRIIKSMCYSFFFNF
jgi:hypothetical protein